MSDCFDEKIGDFNDLGLKCFPKCYILNRFPILLFSENLITSFSTLSTLTNLEKLIINKNFINSFISTNNQPKLIELTIFENPISDSEHLLIMCLIVFGYQLKIINNIPISEEKIKIARSLENNIKSHLLKGFIIESLEPLKLYNPEDESILFLNEDENSILNVQELFPPGNTIDNSDNNKKVRKLKRKKNSTSLTQDPEPVISIKKKFKKKKINNKIEISNTSLISPKKLQIPTQDDLNKLNINSSSSSDGIMKLDSEENIQPLNKNLKLIPPPPLILNSTKPKIENILIKKKVRRSSHSKSLTLDPDSILPENKLLNIIIPKIKKDEEKNDFIDEDNPLIRKVNYFDLLGLPFESSKKKLPEFHFDADRSTVLKLRQRGMDMFYRFRTEETSTKEEMEFYVHNYIQDKLNKKC